MIAGKASIRYMPSLLIVNVPPVMPDGRSRPARARGHVAPLNGDAARVRRVRVRNHRADDAVFHRHRRADVSPARSLLCATATIPGRS